MAAALLDSPILVCLDSQRRAVARSFRERATARLLCVSDCLSARSAAMLCLQAEAGIEKGDRVIMPEASFQRRVVRHK